MTFFLISPYFQVFSSISENKTLYQLFRVLKGLKKAGCIEEIEEKFKNKFPLGDLGKVPNFQVSDA